MKLPIFQKLLELQSGIANLNAWLGGFDPSSSLVLNYGDIPSFIPPSSIQNEDSVSEIWNVLYLMREGRIDEAQSALGAINQKWERMKSIVSDDMGTVTIQ